MPAATGLAGAGILDTLRPELEKAFRDIPAFGSIGFEVQFHAGEPVKILYSATLSRQVKGGPR